MASGRNRSISTGHISSSISTEIKTWFNVTVMFWKGILFELLSSNYHGKHGFDFRLPSKLTSEHVSMHATSLLGVPACNANTVIQSISFKMSFEVLSMIMSKMCSTLNTFLEYLIFLVVFGIYNIELVFNIC